ncbi:MAG TPA: NF038122 family metalloprotease [Rhodopila sp.]|nr:NF038122 family metalloprotease [Rhodopila sp.]
MQINFIYDSSTASAPAAFKTALADAAAYLDGLITNPITVNIQVGWGEDNGAPITPDSLSTGGPQQAGIGMSYAQLKAALAANATSAADQTMLGNMPALDPTNGGSFYITAAQQKAWGLLPATGTEVDGNIGFSATANWTFDPNNRSAAGSYDFIGDAEAEITHALGRLPGLQLSAPGWYSPLDLMRYASPGVNALSVGAPAYFSINGGATDLVAFDTTGDSSDWTPSVRSDAFGDGYTGQTMVMTQTDQTLLDVLGYTVAGAPTPISVPTPTATPVQAPVPVATPALSSAQDASILSLANVAFGGAPTQAEFDAASAMVLRGSTVSQVAMAFMQDPRYSKIYGADGTASRFVHAVFAEAHIPANASVELNDVRSLADRSMSRADLLVSVSESSGHTAYMETLSPAAAGYTLIAASQT